MGGKKKIMVAIRALAIRSTQGLRCVTILQKLFFLHAIRTRDFSGHVTLRAQWSPDLYNHRIWLFFLCYMWFAALGFELCLVSGATDAADESWGVLQQGVLLHAKHKLES